MNSTITSATWEPTLRITSAQGCQYMNYIIYIIQNIFINETGKSQPINVKNISNENLRDITIELPTDYIKSFPAFCSKLAIRHCVITPLHTCQECSNLGAGLFAFAVLVLGIMIIVANSLVIWLFMNKQSAFTGSYGKIKVSLAVADLLAGVLCFFVVLPNLYTTIMSTSLEVVEQLVCLVGSPQAISGGMLYVLTLTTSLYHLVFLSQQRLYAIRCPIRYKNQSIRNVYFVLAVVWTMGFICSIIPLWFPDKTTFGYQHLSFVFIPALKYTDETSYKTELFILFASSSIIPFLLMTGMSVSAGVCLAKKLKRTSDLTSAPTLRRKEVTMFAAMAAMQIGFTITLVPFICYVILGLGNYNANNGLNAIISFYLSLSNSLVNVIVYSCVDGKFRNAIKQLFCSGVRQ